jgi:hypothetical protein
MSDQNQDAEKEEDNGKQETDKVTIEGWYTRAREIKDIDELNVLMKEMMEYDHDYGSITDAFVAAALGAMWCIDKSPTGGITGFQAGWIGMNFLSKWMHIEGPWKRVEFKDMLFNQYEDKFQKTITPNTMEWLQGEAKSKLAQDSDGEIRPELRAHWTSLAEGVPPFGYTIVED